MAVEQQDDQASRFSTNRDALLAGFNNQQAIHAVDDKNKVKIHPNRSLNSLRINLNRSPSIWLSLLQILSLVLTIVEVKSQVHNVNVLEDESELHLRVVADCPSIGKKFKVLESSAGKYTLGTKFTFPVSLPSNALLQCKNFNVEVFSEDYLLYSTRNTSRQVSNFAANHIFRNPIPIFVDKYGKETSERNNDSTYIRNRTEINMIWIENTTIEAEDPSKSLTPKTNYFLPYLETSQFWVLKEQYTKLKDIKANSTFEFEIVFEVPPKRTLELTQAMIETYDTNPLMKEGGEQIKYLLVKNSKEYLIFFFSTMILHIVLQMLAFKNDIQYWKNVKNYQGVSMTMIWWDFAAVIIQLQFCLVKEAPAMMIWLLCFQVISTVYRIGKVYYRGLQFKFPFIQLEAPITYQGKTDTIERKVMKFLMMIMAPCFLIYFLYKAYQLEPEGSVGFELYQLLVSSAMNFVAATEFVRLTPQLYLNYQMKSVPAMPWRTLAYKFVDAIIDDIANYAMGSPTIVLLMHLNDDFAFLVLIYQRYLYREDPNRVEGEEPADQIEDSKKDK